MTTLAVRKAEKYFLVEKSYDHLKIECIFYERKNRIETVEQLIIFIPFSKIYAVQLNQCLERNFVILNVYIKKKNNRQLMSQEFKS